LDGRAGAVLRRDACPAALENRRGDRIECAQFELGVAAQPARAVDGPVRAENHVAVRIDEDEVVAAVVEFIVIAAVRCSSWTVTDFFEENSGAQLLRLLAFGGFGGQSEHPRAAAQRLAIEQPLGHAAHPEVAVGVVFKMILRSASTRHHSSPP